MVQDHVAAEPRSSNGASPTPTDPRTLFGQKIDIVLDRLAKADVSWRSPFTNFRHGPRTLALHVDDVASLLAPLLADEPVPLASCHPTIEAKPSRRSDAADAQSALDLSFPEPDDAMIDTPPFGRGRSPGQRRERTYADVCAALNKEQRAIDRELGLHTLYLLMGQVTWSEIGKPDDTHHSPLLFVPISLVIEDAEWRMRYQEDEVAFVNHVLLKNIAAQMSDARRLAPFMSDFDIETEGRTFDDLVEQLYAAIPPTVSGAMHLDIDPAFVAVAIVKSSNYILYQDLAGLSERMLANPDLIHLFTANELAGFDEAAAFERRRATLDSRPTTETINVLDLDSSQQVALAKAADGDSFILQGPPGTGKSQTIANIIAQTLYQGRTVLFVSKKQEALDVVERRLDEAGLGGYLLTMHAVRTGTKAEMVERLQGLLARYEAMGVAHTDGVSPLFGRIDRLRDDLNDYGDALLTPEPTSAQRPYDVFGRIALRAVGGVPDLAEVFPPSIDAVAYVAGDRTVDDATIEQLAGHGEYSASYAANRWLDATVDANWERWLREQHARVERIFGAVSVARREGMAVARALTATQTPLTFDTAERACAFVDHLGARPDSVEQWLTEDALGADAATTFEALATTWQRRCQRRASLDARVQSQFFALDHARARRDLGDIAPLRRRFVPGPRLNERLFEERHRLAAAIDPHALEVCEAGLARVGAPLGPTLDDLFGLASLLTLIAERPAGVYSEAMLTNPNLPVLIERAEQSWRAYGAAWARVSGKYSPAALAEDLDGLYRAIVNADGFLERRAAPYRGAVDRLQQVRIDRAAPSREEALADLDILRDVRQSQWHHGEALAALAPLNPAMPQDAAEWQALVLRGAWLARVQSTLPPTPRTLALLSQPDGAVRSILAARGNVERAATAWGRAAEELRTASPDSLPSAYNIAALPRATLLEWCGETARLLSPWIDTIASVAATYRSEARPANLAAMDADLAAAQTVAAFDARLADDAPTYRRLFGRLWQGLDTDWERLANLIRWWRAVETSPWWQARGPALVDTLRDTGTCQRLAGHAAALRSALDTLRAECEILEAARVRGVPALAGDTTVDAADAATRGLRDDLDTVGLARTIAALRADAASRPVLDAFLRASHGRVPAALLRDAWAQMVDVAWADAFLQRARERPGAYRALAQFDRPTLEQRRAAFAHDDAQLPEINRERVRRRLDERIGDVVNAAQQTRFSREASRTTDETKFMHTVYQQARTIRDMRPRTRKSVRRILVENGALVRLVAPCWMMSPTSVTQYVDPEALRFDLVIFDEASQLTTADVLPAVARGNQWIFAGDPQQMPPTDFFQVAVNDDGIDETDEDRVESVLDELKLQPAMLRWHYRSKDEALIAFSNYQFYNGRLITFPSPHLDGSAERERAVRWVHVPDGVYARGGDKNNPREADVVAALIVEHWDASVDLPVEVKPSLGVIALSLSQRDAIADALLRSVDGRDDAADIWKRMTDPDSPSFLKNLETIQGNECDAIILSIGFGFDEEQMRRPHQDRRMSMIFGPINRVGGERRLNVAITRARERMTVVASFSPEMMPDSETRGVQVLKDYLRYAKDGPSALPEWHRAARSAERFDSPFEEAVYVALIGRGLRLDTQVGVSRYRIDLAVRDPDHHGRYLLGIECDGATYHGSATARDRDRLRQRELEKLGWTIHRVWSPSWFTNPIGEVNRVLQVVEALRVASNEEVAAGG